LEEWDEIWDMIRNDQELVTNNFIRSLYQQWLKKSEGPAADQIALLSQRQMHCLILTIDPVQLSKAKDQE
jgi:hypothetical protein